MTRRRLTSALVIVPAMLAGVCFLPTIAVLALLIALSFLGIFEFYRMLDAANIPSFRFVGAACGALLQLATYCGFKFTGVREGAAPYAADWGACILVGTVMILMVRQFPQKKNDKPIPTIACTLLGVLYVPLLLNYFIKLGLTWDNVDWNEPLHGHTGWPMVFYSLLVIKMTDAGALFTGMAIGRHKMFPRLSPSKTWEGMAGGLVTGTGLGWLYIHVNGDSLGAVQVNTYHAVVMGVTVSLAGMLGDLSESLLKRAAAVKDSGRLIPGIGGVLDVLDSLLFGVPVMYYYIRLAL